jgi:hypothetical protein
MVHFNKLIFCQLLQINPPSVSFFFTNVEVTGRNFRSQKKFRIFQISMSSVEYLDVLDEDGKWTGVAKPRSEVHKNGLWYVRS